MRDSTGLLSETYNVEIEVVISNETLEDSFVTLNEDGTFFIDWAAFDLIEEKGVFSWQIIYASVADGVLIEFEKEVMIPR